MRGYLRVSSPGRVALAIGGVLRRARVTAWENGHLVAHRRVGGLLRFRLDAEPGRAADWAVIW